MKDIFMYILILLWVVLTINTLYDSFTTEADNPPQEICQDANKNLIKCGERIFIKPQDPNTGYIWVNYNEADIPFIACSFTKDGTFFCVNTKTGKIWVPIKMGVIV